MLQQSPDILFANHKTLLNVPAQQFDKSEFEEQKKSRYTRIRSFAVNY